MIPRKTIQPGGFLYSGIPAFISTFTAHQASFGWSSRTESGLVGSNFSLGYLFKSETSPLIQAFGNFGDCQSDWSWAWSLRGKGPKGLRGFILWDITGCAGFAFSPLASLGRSFGCADEPGWTTKRVNQRTWWLPAIQYRSLLAFLCG